jgi:hypothetical protein
VTGCFVAELHQSYPFYERSNSTATVWARCGAGWLASTLGSLPNFGRRFASLARLRPTGDRPHPKNGTDWPLNSPTDNSSQMPAASPVIRTLVAGLITTALIPNLTLGSIFWFSLTDNSSSRAAIDLPRDHSPPLSRSKIPFPVLSAPAVIEANAGGETTFPIALDGTDGVPARSVVAIRGLPAGSKLSSGRAYDETEWNLKPDEIGDLYLVLPSTVEGDAKLVIQLVATDGAILADAATVLRTKGSPFAANLSSTTEPSGVQVLGELVAREPAEPAEGPVDLEKGTSQSPDLVPLPLKRPAQASNEDAKWITLTSVNLRKKPTRSAPSITVVAKGTKLNLIGRKRNWVQVTSLATSEEGWIYARHIASLR